MFMFPMKVEKDGEFILISNRSDLEQFVAFANLYLGLTQLNKDRLLEYIQPSEEVGLSLAIQAEPAAVTKPHKDAKADSKPLSLRRAERIHEVGLLIGRPFFAREIASAVSSEPLFKTPGGTPLHVIRMAMREYADLFTRLEDGTGASISNPPTGGAENHPVKSSTDGETNIDRIGVAVKSLGIKTRAELRQRVREVVSELEDRGWPTRAETPQAKQETVLATVRRYGTVLFGDDTDSDGVTDGHKSITADDEDMAELIRLDSLDG